MVFSAFLSPMLTVFERLFDSVAPSICLILDEEESLLAQKPTLSKLVPTVNVRFITLFCFLGYWSRVVLSTPTSQPTSQTQNIDLNFFQPFQGIKITGVSGSFGFVVDSCDVNGDGIPDFIGSAPYANSNVGLVAVVYGGLGQGTVNINTMTPSEGFLIYGDSSLFSATDKPRTGAALACVGDFNGDTYQDIGIGAVGGASIAPGRAYLIFGKNKTNTNIYLQNLTLSQGFYVTRLGATSSVGYSVRGIDANKDGYSDFLVGELYGAHQNYLIYGRASDWQNLNFASLNSAYGITFSNFCPDTNNYCYGGYAVGNANDVNGDGVPDMIMSAYRYTYLPTSFVWIVYGSYTISGLNLLSSPLSKAFRISGRSFDRLGTVLSQGAGNFNGDTYSDVLLGSPGDSQYIAYLIYGNKTNAYINATKWDSSRGIRFSRSSNDGTFAAGSVSWLGDLNGDGLDDIGISSITPTGYKRTVYVIFGSKNMVDIQLGSLSPSQGFQIYGTVGTASNNGLRLASLRGDVNGDGWSDYVIGDPDRNTVYIVYGNTYQTSPPSTQPSTSPTKNPSFSPTFPPTRTPTRAPTFPTLIPTQPPTTFPSFLPTSEPTLIPTLVPTLMPTTSPSNQPTTSPTYRPSLCPTLIPTNVPTASPTAFPTVFPSAFPSNEPTLTPSLIPTLLPSGEPTFIPTVLPTNSPTLSPSIFPSTWPSCLPTDNPSRIPTFIPTQLPSCSPSEAPTLLPTLMPTNFPTLLPTDIPTIWPSSVPIGNPSLQPTFSPTLMPSGMPTLVPTLIPTSWPTDSPTFPPTTWPSNLPSPGPSFSPSWVPSMSPSHEPTFIPTWLPTNSPTLSPSIFPSTWPSCLPTDNPSRIPTFIPTQLPSCSPSEAPTLLPTLMPTNFPTFLPTDIPTIWPSSVPTGNPSLQPTFSPTLMPSGMPTLVPTLMPTSWPTDSPIFPPTTWPSHLPSPGPSFSPTWVPSISPSHGPTFIPTWVPTNGPTLVPTDIPTIWPSSLPTDNPSVQPTYLPTLMPSGTPILVPTLIPTHPPSGLPTFPPTQWPTDVPSPGPSFSPSWQPSINPTTGKPTWRPTWVPTNTPQPTKSRLASRSITIELADDQQAIGALTEIAYSEQSDQLILATDHFMFSAQQWNWGNIGGYMFQELANGQNIFVTSGLGYTYFIEQLPANALGIVKYDEANSRYGLWSSMTYRPILSGCLVQGRYLVLTEVMSAGVFRLNIIQSVSMVFSVGLQYQIPGAVATVSVSCGDDVSSPCLYQGGYDAKGVLILQVPDISQVSFSGLGGMVYACRDLSAQAGDVYQLSRLVRTTSGGLLGLIQITHHGISARYQCFKIDRDESGLGMPRWAVNLDAQPTDIISIGDDEALLCGSDARFDAALGNQAVLMRLSAEGELIEAVRIISLFPTQGRCRLTSAGTRGVAFCIATVLASGKQAMLCGMVKLAPSGLEVLSLPSDVFSVSVSSMNRFNVSFVTLLMTKKSMYLAAMNVGYSLSPSSISVVSIALVSNGVLFAPTQPSASPTVRLTKSPTMLPTWWPTVAPSVPPSFFPSKMPSFWPTFRPTNVGETNIPSVKPSFFPSFWPSMQPSRKPSSAPSIGLTIPPTVALQPTRKPTVCPTLTPTLVPSVGPTKKGETNRPSITIRPSTKPSLLPTLWPSFFPTLFPTQRGATNVPTLPPTPKMIVIIEPGQISSAGAKEAQQPNDMMAVFYGVLGFVGVIVLLIGALLLGIYGLPMFELSYFCVKYKIQPSSFVDKDELIDRFLSERCRHKSIDSRVLASIERIADIFCQRMLTCEEATVDWSVIQILLNHIYDALAIGDVEVGLNGALTEGVIAHIAEVLVTLYTSKQVDDMPSAMTEIMLTCTMRLGTIIEEKCDDDSDEGKMSDEVFSSDLSVDTDSSLGEGVHLGVESNRSL